MGIFFPCNRGGGIDNTEKVKTWHVFLVHCSISVVGCEEGNNDLLAFFMPLNFKGLHTNDFLCSATTVGCFGLHEPACVGGLPMNLLLLLMAVGVAVIVSVAVLNSGNGENSFEYLAFRGSLKSDCLPPRIALPYWKFETEGCSGVVMCELCSGLRVAMDTLLLGWITFVVDVAWGGGLTAMEIRLGFTRLLMLVSAIMLPWRFSLSTEVAILFLMVVIFRGGTGDGGGMKLVILRSGILNFEGPKGGFFSVFVFPVASFIVDSPEDWVDAAAKALVSCLILVFLSFSNWFSRSRTCYKVQ